MQRISLIHQFILKILADFIVPGRKRLQPYLSILKVTFSFSDTMYEHAENQFISFIHLLTLWPGWLQPLLTTPTPIFFHQLLISDINM